MNVVLENMKQMRRAMNPFVFTIFEIVKESKPEVVFEIGVRGAQSTRTILAALQENEKGILYSCDIKDYSDRVIPKELKERWNFKVMPSGDYVKEWKLSIDILIIDGAHDYDNAKLDFHNYSPFVKPGGLILLHDIVHNEPYGVYKLFNQIRWPKVGLCYGAGLGIVQKPPVDGVGSYDRYAKK